MEDFITGLCIGLTTWFFTYGFNRIYLLFKTFLQF